MKLPTVVIGIPTYQGKAYCEDQFFNAVLALEYPRNRMAIMVVDNTLDGGKYSTHLREKYPEFKIVHQANQDVVYKRLFDSHERLRIEFLKTGAKYLLHLESDVIVPPDIIQRLLRSRKDSVSPIYNLSLGSNRHVVQRNRQWGMPFADKYSWGYTYGRVDQDFADGTVKKIQTNGLGCILLKKGIMEHVPFRYRPNVDSAPDSAFTHDLLIKGIDNFCDTSIVVYHANGEDWGQDNINLIEKYEGQF